MTLWTKRAGKTLAALAIAAAAALAAPAHADTPIDPRLYLPPVAEGDSFFVATVKVPAVLKLEAFKKVREEHKLDEELAKAPVNLKPEDIAEFVIVGAGNFEEDTPKAYALIRLTKDLGPKELAKDAAKLGESKSISGFDVYSPKDEGGEVNFVTKVAPGTILVVPGKQEDGLKDYLAHIARKKAFAYPAGVTAAAKKAGTGDVIILAGIASKDPSAPESMAVTVSLSEPLKLAGAMKMKDEDSATKAIDMLKALQETLPVKVPNLEFATEGAMLTIKASATKKEMSTFIEDVSKLLPFGGGAGKGAGNDGGEMK